MQSQETRPEVSVILPAHNAAAYLGRTLSAIRDSTFKNIELIVVNDRSSDDTEAVAREFGALVLQSERPGQGAARNTGVGSATAPLIVFIDADCVVHPTTIQQFHTLMTGPDAPAAAFGSYDDDPAARTPVSMFKNLKHHWVHQHGNPEASTYWTGCAAVRTDVYREVGGLKDAGIFCLEDVEFGHRLLQRGYRIRLAPEIQVKHLKQWELLKLIKTDVLYRGVPWTIAMMQKGKSDADLNLGMGERIAAAAAIGVVVGLLISPWIPILGLTLVVLCLAAIITLNWQFYRLLSRQGDWRLKIAAVPLHILYYLYSWVGLACGLYAWYFMRDRIHQACQTLPRAADAVPQTPTPPDRS